MIPVRHIEIVAFKEKMKTKDIIIGLAVAVILVLLFSPFASEWPDGLERVAQDKGFLSRSENAIILNAPMPDYSWKGLKNKRLSMSATGVIGVALVFGLTYGLALFLRRNKSARKI